MAEGAYLSAEIILELLKDDKVDAIGGLTLGADPLVGAIAVLSFELKHPVKTFIIRKTPKPHGKQQQIEGPLLNSEDCVVLVDDVATTGKAFLESLDVLEKIGVSVKKAVCLVDRDEGAKAALKKRGCALIALFTASDFL